MSESMLKTTNDKVLERLFKNRLIIEKGCWLWTGAESNQGYGVVIWEDKLQKVHRLAYIATYGELKNLALHKCNVKLCFNPEHLYDGTYSDNSIDRVKVYGAISKPRIRCPKGHEYTPENSGKRGRFGRRCKECNKQAQQNYRDQRRKE